MSRQFDFNKGLSELESIIHQMESGDLGLEESLKYFEKGVKIYRQCHTALSDAEQRISLMSAGDDYSSEKTF